MLLLGVGAALVALAGCGSSSGSATGAPSPNAPESNAAGDIPDSQVYVPFNPPGGGFTVSVPQGWAQSAEADATVFSDKYNSVRIDSRPAPGPVDVPSVRTADVPTLQAAVPGFVLGSVTAVQRSGGNAVLVTYQATSPPNQVTGATATLAVERYAFTATGREVILTLSGPKDADNVDPWRKITDSFRWRP